MCTVCVCFCHAGLLKTVFVTFFSQPHVDPVPKVDQNVYWATGLQKYLHPWHSLFRCPTT